jgi:hypothetical protein
LTSEREKRFGVEGLRGGGRRQIYLGDAGVPWQPKALGK